MKITRIKTIALKEFNAYMFSPVAYIVIALFTIVSGIFFWSVFFLQNQAELRNYFNMLPWIYTFIVPAITMRLFAEEKNTGSYEILVTLPLKLEEIVLGKFLGAFFFIISLNTLIIFYAICVDLVGDLDWGPVIGGWIGSLFLITAYNAIGLFSSSLTKNQVIAFLVGLFIMLFFFLIDKFLPFLPLSIINFFNSFSADYHFKNITKGILDSRNIFYFIFLATFFLIATYYSLKSKFLSHKS